MTNRNHATDDTLMRFAAGTLAAGPAIVVEAHLASCPVCRARVGEYEALGGSLLEEMEPTPLSATVLSDMLAMLDDEEATGAAVSPPLAGLLPLG